MTRLVAMFEKDKVATEKCPGKSRARRPVRDRGARNARCTGDLTAAGGPLPKYLQGYPRHAMACWCTVIA